MLTNGRRYTGKDQIRPLNAVHKQRNCHIKFAVYDDEVAILGNGNQGQYKAMRVGVRDLTHVPRRHTILDALARNQHYDRQQGSDCRDHG